MPDASTGQANAPLASSRRELATQCREAVRYLLKIVELRIARDTALEALRQQYDNDIAEAEKKALELGFALELYAQRHRSDLLRGGVQKIFRNVVAEFKWYFVTSVKKRDSEDLILKRIKAAGLGDTFIKTEEKLKINALRAALRSEETRAQTELLGVGLHTTEFFQILPERGDLRFVRAGPHAALRIETKD